MHAARGLRPVAAIPWFRDGALTCKEAAVEDQEDRTRRDDGTEPVHEHRPDSPGPARAGTQYLVIIIGALILLAALMWFILPFGVD